MVERAADRPRVSEPPSVAAPGSVETVGVRAFPMGGGFLADGLEPEHVLALQRTAGNRAVTKLLRAPAKPRGQTVYVPDRSVEELPEGTDSVVDAPPGSGQARVETEAGRWIHDNYEQFEDLLREHANKLTKEKLPDRLEPIPENLTANRQESLTPGLEKESPVPDTRTPGRKLRIDRLDRAGGRVIEIKPAHLYDQGLAEAKMYADYMNRFDPLPNGRKWKAHCATYDQQRVIAFLREIGVLTEELAHEPAPEAPRPKRRRKKKVVAVPPKVRKPGKPSTGSAPLTQPVPGPHDVALPDDAAPTPKRGEMDPLYAPGHGPPPADEAPPAKKEAPTPPPSKSRIRRPSGTGTRRSGGSRQGFGGGGGRSADVAEFVGDTLQRGLDQLNEAGIRRQVEREIEARKPEIEAWQNEHIDEGVLLMVTILEPDPSKPQGPGMPLRSFGSVAIQHGGRSKDEALERWHSEPKLLAGAGPTRRVGQTIPVWFPPKRLVRPDEWIAGTFASPGAGFRFQVTFGPKGEVGVMAFDEQGGRMLAVEGTVLDAELDPAQAPMIDGPPPRLFVSFTVRRPGARAQRLRLRVHDADTLAETGDGDRLWSKLP